MGEPGLEGAEPMQRVVELEQRVRLLVDGEMHVVERDAVPNAATLERDALSRAIDEDVAHRERRDGEEV